MVKVVKVVRVVRVGYFQIPGRVQGVKGYDGEVPLRLGSPG